VKALPSSSLRALLIKLAAQQLAALRESIEEEVLAKTRRRGERQAGV